MASIRSQESSAGGVFGSASLVFVEDDCVCGVGEGPDSDSRVIGSNFSRKRAERNDNQRAREEIPATPSDLNENFEASSDEQEIQSSSSRRAQYTRHTPSQTEELEKYFKKNAHPDEKERAAIGRKLGIDVKKVKFWFQNKRTQLKAQTERHENSTLRKQNKQMKLELLSLQEVAKNALCIRCDAQATIPNMPICHDHNIEIENARLREELSRITNHFNQLMEQQSLDTSRLPNNITYHSETSKKDQEGIQVYISTSFIYLVDKSV
ncbi:homeobox-leucine zipper protein ANTHOCYANINLESS 2-like [Bidens hawaiensis]|uniref:homeobox-leucine zipper protein ANTHOCYANINLESS 2-like n=1 Tax=Bidens hawaiensis TaxID=980011 RepID=UPI00404B2224